MSAVYALIFATLMMNVTTVVTASMRGVAATRTPARNVARARVTVPATTLTWGKPISRYVEIGDRRCPTKGAAMTIATSGVRGADPVRRPARPGRPGGGPAAGGARAAPAEAWAGRSGAPGRRWCAW